MSSDTPVNSTRQPGGETPGAARSCPVQPYIFIGPTEPALTKFKRMDAFRAAARPALRSEEAGGYTVFTDHDVILDGLQNPAIFSSSVIVPVDPDPPYKWIPIMLDPPLHTEWRQLLGSWFTPKRVASMKDDQARFAAELIDRLAADGECEFVGQFAQLFPTTIFLKILGLPVGELDQFMEWEHLMLHLNDESDPDGQQRLNGMQSVVGYLAQVIGKRRQDPDPDQHDIISAAIGWQLHGQPVSDEDVLSCLLLLFMAGLDTVAAQLGYMVHHLANHPEDRRRITADPAIIPHAVEEMMRAYPIVQTARKVTADTEFHGCPLHQGDMVAFPLAAAGRDETVYEHADEVDLDRETVRHLSFGAGPHRCLGSHLARQELAVALEEWHRRIPDYEVVGTPLEHGGGVYGIDAMRLRW